MSIDHEFQKILPLRRCGTRLDRVGVRETGVRATANCAGCRGLCCPRMNPIIQGIYSHFPKVSRQVL